MPVQKKPFTKEKALDRLTTICSKSEQCEFEINRKLLNWRINLVDRREIIDYLKNNRYLDDERFAKSYAKDKARFSYWGPSKIRGELIKRRINSAIIKVAIENVESSAWKEGLLKCATSKAKNLDLLNVDAWNNRQKLFRYLISRGFPSNVSSKTVDLMRKQQERNERMD